MKDLYPTRKKREGRFIERSCPVSFTENYQYYTDNGFMVIRNFFSNDLVNSLIEHDYKGMITMEPESNTVRAISGFHKNMPVIETKELISIVSEILGGGFYVHQSRINYKKSLSGSGWSWHSDFETWHSQDGMPLMRCLTAMIPLTENVECNGSLMVIPKSHKLFYSCPKGKNSGAKNEFADQKEGVPTNDAIKGFFDNSKDEIIMIKCSPGDLVLFDCNIMHVSTSNMSSKDRCNMFMVYNSVENLLINPTRPEELGSSSIHKVFV
mgnify:CR=1 FL=1